MKIEYHPDDDTRKVKSNLKNEQDDTWIPIQKLEKLESGSEATDSENE